MIKNQWAINIHSCKILSIINAKLQTFNCWDSHRCASRQVQFRCSLWRSADYKYLDLQINKIHCSCFFVCFFLSYMSQLSFDTFIYYPNPSADFKFYFIILAKKLNFSRAPSARFCLPNWRTSFSLLVSDPFRLASGTTPPMGPYTLLGPYTPPPASSVLPVVHIIVKFSF